MDHHGDLRNFVVYDWQRGTSADQVSAAAVTAADGLRRYVFMSSIAVYGAGGEYDEELGLELTPLEDGLRETYRWYQQQQRPQPDFSWEDRLLVSAR